MEHLHRNFGHLIRSPQTAHQLMIVKNITKRLTKHPYLENALTRYYEKYEDKFNFRDYWVDDSNNSNFKTYKDPRPPKQQKEFMEAGKHSDMMEKQDYDYLFKFLHKHMKDFWD